MDETTDGRIARRMSLTTFSAGFFELERIDLEDALAISESVEI